MSAQNTASIQTLLEAEREAQQIVERARAYRQQRLKDARTEAGKDVETYKQKKDAEFKEYEKKNSGSNDDIEAQSNKDVEKQIADIEQSHKDGKKTIVDGLLKALVKAEPEMHRNAVKV